jgi:hypothetical protein
MNTTNNEARVAFNDYRVEVRAKFPACGEYPGMIEVTARNAKDAISIARREMARNGHTRQDGPLVYRIVRD